MPSSNGKNLGIFSRSNCFKKDVSLKVVETMIGPCSTKAKEPFLSIFPVQYGTYSRIAAKNVDFPEPTSPIRPWNPFALKLILRSIKVGLDSSLFYEIFQYTNIYKLNLTLWNFWYFSFSHSTDESFVFLGFACRTIPREEVHRSLSDDSEMFSKLMFQSVNRPISIDNISILSLSSSHRNWLRNILS